jgi:RNA polymerase sigma-70 factor (ECF subfamily)
MQQQSPTGPEGLNDESILAGLAAGDTEAGRLFVRRFQARVYGVAVGILRDRAAAEDVAQETFVRAWRHADAFDARRGTVSAWLLRITHNLAIDRLRLREPQVVDPSLLATLDLVSSGPSVEDAAVTSDTTTEVRAALRQLPVEQSRALLLAAFYGHTAEEISRSENIPLGTAKTRIRLGLRRIRSLLVETDQPAGEVR